MLTNCMDTCLLANTAKKIFITNVFMWQNIMFMDKFYHVTNQYSRIMVFVIQKSHSIIKIVNYSYFCIKFFFIVYDDIFD